MTNTRAPNFRFIYTNANKLNFNNNEVMLIFGLKEDFSVNNDDMQEDVGVVMTPVSAKLLATTLLKTIAHFEKTMGIEIPVDPGKIENLERILSGYEAMGQR